MTAAPCGGLHIAAVDLSDDSKADILTGPGSGLPPEVRIFDAKTLTPEGRLRFAEEP